MDMTESPAVTPAKPKSPAWNIFSAVQWSDRVLGWTRRLLTEPRYEALESWVVKVGYYGLIVAAGLGLFCGIAAALKWDQLSPFFIGVAWIPFVGVAQYFASKFMSTSRELIKSTGTCLSLGSFLDCIALWSMALGIVALLSFTFAAIRMDSFSLFGIGIGICLILELVTWLCLNPPLLNICIQPAPANWEEALGIIAFHMKTHLRLVPIVFGTGVVVGDFALLNVVIRLFRGDLDSMAGAGTAALVVMVSALLPFIAYILFLLNYLLIDVLRAILSIPGKIELLSRK